MRDTTQQEKDVFAYLNDLRESGETNMFGASPYVERKFKIPSREAISLVTMWMNNFDEHGNYEQVKI
jgi:hypothetical protein